MIANVATKNKMQRNVIGDVVEFYFSDKALADIKRTSIGSWVSLKSFDRQLGKVTDSWIENNLLFVEFSCYETFNMNYLVPSISVASSNGGLIKTARVSGYLLTNTPLDKALLNLSFLNDNFIRDEGLIKFKNEDGTYSIGYDTFTEANKMWLKSAGLLKE